MEFFQLIFKKDQYQIVQLGQFLKLFFENVVVVGQLGLFVINIPLHEKSLKSPFVAIERLYLLFIDGHSPSKVVHFSSQTLYLLN